MKQIYKFPLKQHIGKDAKPLVDNGVQVKRGQLIAKVKEGALGANIYSSVSGTVCEVTTKYICVDADENQAGKYVKLKSKEPLELIQEAGIVGLGGAGFPTCVKFASPFEEGGTIIINAAECEPLLGHNIVRIEAHPEQLVRGLEIAMEVANAAEGVVAIKEYHSEAISALEQALAEAKHTNIRIHKLEDIYPMGEERAIIREVLGVLMPVDSLPLQAGAIVLNAETACRIAEAVDDKKPLIDKDITVAGKIAGNEPDKMINILLDVPLGTPVKRLFERVGGEANHGLADNYGEIIMGGPFTGKRTELSAPIIKTTGGLIAAECFPKGPDRIGLLVCACGASRERMEEIAASMGSEVMRVEYCKQARDVSSGYKCENPGKCPGQVQKVMNLKKAGSQAVLIGNCTDCSNTVMSCAPQLGLAVYHCTDGALRAVNKRLIRRHK